MDGHDLWLLFVPLRNSNAALFSSSFRFLSASFPGSTQYLTVYYGPSGTLPITEELPFLLFLGRGFFVSNTTSYTWEQNFRHMALGT